MLYFAAKIEKYTIRQNSICFILPIGICFLFYLPPHTISSTLSSLPRCRARSSGRKPRRWWQHSVGSTVFSIVIFLPLSGARVIKRWHKWQKNTKIIIYLEFFSYLYAQFHSFFDVPLDIKKKIETHLLVLSFVLPSIVACMWNSGGTRQMSQLSC